MKNNTLYIGGSIRPHLVLSLIPIIDGFCKKKNINKIIFEKNISNKIKSNVLFKKLHEKYTIYYLDKLSLNKNFFLRSLIRFLFFLFFYFASFFFKEKYLLNQSISWLTKQIFHSYWDTGIINNTYKLDKIEFKSRIKSCIQFSNKFLDFWILKIAKIKYAFFGHMVYSERFLFALIRNEGVEMYRYNGSILIKQEKKFDRDSKYIDKKIYKKSFKFISNNQIKEYWSNLQKGHSKNEEVNFAIKIKSQKKKYNSKAINVIMLHIFKDSSFDDIDVNRIFHDYYSWVFETLKIIKNSKEVWILRKHPSADRWGENQKQIVNDIFKKVFGDRKPSNILFEENSRSNFEQFKISKRIITYSGSSHLEAACLGLKPIVISDVDLIKYNKNYVFKPKNYNEYKNLLLKHDRKYFYLGKNKNLIPKRVMFLLQNVVNFSDYTGCRHLFRKDSKKLFNSTFNDTKKKIKINYNYLFKIGYNIGAIYNQGINKKYYLKF